MDQHRRGTAVVQAAPLHKEAEREQYTARQTSGIWARVSSGGGLLAVHGGSFSDVEEISYSDGIDRGTIRSRFITVE
ncbi:hypothetical protein RDI58_016836 [Solanum bulbocastanum]|uniref:Uncharacterized protein n=1 Tax=Solanum bulbocastanum TaxID=147425 RepID=A0AAN8TMR4_SOLBU